MCLHRLQYRCADLTCAFMSYLLDRYLLDPKVDPKVDSKVDTQVDSKVDPEVDSKIDFQIVFSLINFFFS